MGYIYVKAVPVGAGAVFHLMGKEIDIYNNPNSFFRFSCDI